MTANGLERPASDHQGARLRGDSMSTRPEVLPELCSGMWPSRQLKRRRVWGGCGHDLRQSDKTEMWIEPCAAANGDVLGVPVQLDLPRLDGICLHGCVSNLWVAGRCETAGPAPG